MTFSPTTSNRRILDLAIKDLRQITRDWKSFLFLLVMPIAFTLLFGFAFGGNSTADPRLPIGLLDEDGSELSQQLAAMLSTSEVVRIEAQDVPILARPGLRFVGIADDVFLLGFLVVLFTGERNDQLRAAGEVVADYIRDILRYLTFNDDTKPFPFGADFPGRSNA